MGNSEAYRDDVFAIEREVRFEADLLRIAQANDITPETVLQGYLGHRWKRRNGDIYSVPGAWNDFESVPGLTTNTIRWRQVEQGRAIQMVGAMSVPLSAFATAIVGTMPVGARPARYQRVAGICQVNLTIGWMMWELRTNGDLALQNSIASTSPTVTTMDICAVFALD
jgi:hypothetical protein